MDTTPRAAAYLRISDDREGTGLGVTRQRDDCLALIDRNGYELVEVFDDTTAEAITADGIQEYVETLPEDSEIRREGTNDEGVEYDLTVQFDTPGTWAANCWVVPGAGFGEGLDVAILTVSP